MLNVVRVFFALLLIYILAVLINPALAPEILPDIANNRQIDGWVFFGRDKLGHFFLIGTAAMVLNFLLQAKRISILKTSFLLGSVIIAVLVTLEELRQVPLPDRSFEMFDIFYNFAGIFVFGRVGAWLAGKF